MHYLNLCQWLYIYIYFFFKGFLNQNVWFLFKTHVFKGLSSSSQRVENGLKFSLVPCWSFLNEPPTQKQGALLDNLCAWFLFFLCASLQHWQDPTIAALSREQERGKLAFTCTLWIYGRGIGVLRSTCTKIWALLQLLWYYYVVQPKAWNEIAFAKDSPK